MKRSLRISLPLLVLAAILLHTNVGSAQTHERPHSLEAGAWALLFQVDHVPSLDFFDGMLSMKHHLSRKHALRFGLGGNGSTGEDRAAVQYGVSLQLQYLLYPQPGEEINVYLGTGPRVGRAYSRIDRPDDQFVRTGRTEVGLTGRLGVEWFATKSISIFGEYGNEFGARFESRDRLGEDQALRDFFYRSQAYLGLAAYF